MVTQNPPDRQGTLRIDPVACDGIGMCAYLAPDVIELDRWGYPVIPRDRIEGTDARAAIRAVRGCPRAALRFDGIGGS